MHRSDRTRRPHSQSGTRRFKMLLVHVHRDLSKWDLGNEGQGLIFLCIALVAPANSQSTPIDLTAMYTWSLNALIVIRIHTDFVSLLRKGVFAVLDGPELVMRLQIRPTPQTTIDHVR